MKKFMIGILGLSLVIACNSGSSESEAGNTENQTTADLTQKDISVLEARELMNENDVVVIDVRTADEYSSGHIEGAVNLNVNSNEFNYSIADLDPSKKYVLYCHSGKRSARASEFMIDSGFETVYNVLGGIGEWKNIGYEVIVE